MQESRPIPNPRYRPSRAVPLRVPTQPAMPLVLGLALTASYGFFAALAASHYPGAYSPAHNNTLSQLGNRNLNPHGAVFYLVGCALSGVFAIAFFASLPRQGLTGTLTRNRLLLLIQGFGVVGGFGLVMNAVYPENQLSMHHLWAGVVFNGFGAAMLLSPLALWRPGRSNISLVGFAAVVCAALLVMFVFAGTHWLEWPPIVLFLLSPCLLGLYTYNALKHGAKLIAEPAPVCSSG